MIIINININDDGGASSELLARAELTVVHCYVVSTVSVSRSLVSISCQLIVCTSCPVSVKSPDRNGDVTIGRV